MNDWVKVKLSFSAESFKLKTSEGEEEKKEIVKID